MSEELAKVTGSSHVQAGMKAETPLVRLDPTTLVDNLLKRDRQPRAARLLSRLLAFPVLEVTYWELLEGEREFSRFAKFLEIAKPLLEVCRIWQIGKSKSSRHNRKL